MDLVDIIMKLAAVAVVCVAFKITKNGFKEIHSNQSRGNRKAK